MPITTRTKLTEQLNSIETLLKSYSRKAAGDIRGISEAAKGDKSVAEKVLGGRKAEDRLRSQLEDTCFDVMLLQQPLIGADFRFVTGAFRIVSDLSHIDDMTRDATFLLQEMPQKSIDKFVDEFAQMAEISASMVEDSITAFLDSDVEKAQVVIETDDKVNSLYGEATDRLVGLIRDGKGSAKYLPELLMVGKYFERIGDLAKSIADWAIFRSTGAYRGHVLGENE